MSISSVSNRCLQPYQGRETTSSRVCRALPIALQVPVEVVTNAVEDTERQFHEAGEATWRAAL